MDDRMRPMAEATRLTREGSVLEATKVIQRTLGFPRSGAAPAHAPSDVRDAEYRVAEEQETARHAPWESRTGWSTAPQPVRSAPPLLSGQIVEGSTAVEQPWEEATHQAGGLRELLDRALHARHGSGAVHTSPSPAVVPGTESGRFLAERYTGAAGTRSYKLYVPAGYRGQAVPLLVMLHGCTQDADDFATGTRMNVLAERGTFLVVYPEQAARANGQRCWNWFQPDHQMRDTGEPAIVAGITRQIMVTYRVDPARVYVAGMSAGGAMAAIMSAAYPDLYAAAGIHSGLPSGAARSLQAAFQLMRGDGRPPISQKSGSPSPAVPIIVFHGDQDTTVSSRNAEHVVEQWLAAAAHAPRVTVHEGQTPGGRAYTRTNYSNPEGQVGAEKWIIQGGGHAWSGGSPDGSFSDPSGPDASAEMARFFREHPHEP